MTLYELQNKLGEQIDLITDKTRSPEERKKLAEMAMAVSSLAKQMINNECHRVAGTPTAMTRFSKVLNSLWKRNILSRSG